MRKPIPWASSCTKASSARRSGARCRYLRRIWTLRLLRSPVRGSIPQGLPSTSVQIVWRGFLCKENQSYRIAKEIRDMVIFAPHNVLSDPPFTKLDLLSCRNLLIYLDTALQKRLLPVFHYALRPHGLLFLGTSETIDGFDDLFTAVDKRWKLYARKETASTPLVPGLALAGVAAQQRVAPPTSGTMVQRGSDLPRRHWRTSSWWNAMPHRVSSSTTGAIFCIFMGAPGPIWNRRLVSHA